MSANTCRYLTALLTEGSFSKAAQTLDISQPSLSQFLLRLETEAGTTLIDRAAKPLRLTPAGELFLKTERQIEQLRDMSQSAPPTTGKLFSSLRCSRFSESAFPTLKFP